MATYIDRAIALIHHIHSYIWNMEDMFDLCDAVETFNADYHKGVRVECGLTRAALVYTDFVIKFDRKDAGDETLHTFGTCETEYNFYKKAEQEGFAYLFAESTKFSYKGTNYYIMPRIHGIDTARDEIEEYLTEEETDFLYDNLFDLHSGNFGFREGYPCIIDYAAVC